MTRVVVNPGVCGKIATVNITKVGKRRIKVDITSDCEMVINMGELLSEVDQWEALKSHESSSIYKYASKCNLHISCPVPMAILKAIEVEAGLTLPRTIVVQFEATGQG
jgi:hypothetical protein